MLRDAQTDKQNPFLRDPGLDATRQLETSVVTLANLWRHERALTRSMHRALHEPQRLQAIPAGEYVPAPAVVDVNLNLAPEHSSRNNPFSPAAPPSALNRSCSQSRAGGGVSNPLERR